MSFEKLLDELETMSKAMPSDDTGEDDKKIQAAAAEGGEGDVSNDDDKNDDVSQDDDDNDLDNGSESDKEGDDDRGMTKSFQFTLESGEVIEAQDGTKLVKSLISRVEKNEAVLTKALGTAVTLIKSQGELIKSLQSKVDNLSGQGRGRKAIVSVVEKQSTALVKSVQEEGMSANEFMAKALEAQAKGLITGLDVSRAEAHLNKGLRIPDDIVAKVAK